MRLHLPTRGQRKSVEAATLLILCAATGLGKPLAAQAIRLPMPLQRVHPNSVNVGTTVSVFATPTSVNYTLVAGSTSTGGNAISITSTVTLPLNTTLNLYGYFVSSTAALTGSVSGSKIPTSAVYGIVPTGLPTTYTAFTQTGPFGGAAASLKLVNVTGIAVLYSRTDNLTLQINLSGVAVPADTYIGTLNLQAQVF